MTIRPGEEWGRAVAVPDGLRLASDDAELSTLLTDGTGLPTAVGSGDLGRTVGARPLGARDQVRELPIDLLDVSIDGAGPITAVAHVIVRTPWWRGGWWRGEVVAVLNAEFVGPYDVAPRGHPNDGRVEVQRLDPATSPRVRRAILRRMRSASHLPHPAISARTTRSIDLEFDRAVVVLVDGVIAGRARTLRIDVRADAAIVLA